MRTVVARVVNNLEADQVAKVLGSAFN